MDRKAPTVEHERLAGLHGPLASWRRWGPYVAERSWGTVREDYSPDGDAWGSFPHDLARSRAYRWGEDGIAGICDRYQLLGFALAFWNGRDPILKERLFGVVPARGQPRRGREGVLLLPRLDADPLVHEVPLQVPAARIPLRAAGRREPGARTGEGRSSSCSTPASSTRTATSTSSSSTRKATPEDMAVRIDRHNRGPRRRAPPRRCRTCGSATRGPGARSRGPSRRSGRANRAAGSAASSPTTPRPTRCATCPSTIGSARATLYVPPAASCCSPTTRRMRERVYGGEARQPQALRQGRLPPPHRRRRDRPSIPARVGTKAARATTGALVPAGGSVELPLPALGLRRHQPRRRPARRGGRDHRRAARRRPTSSTQRPAARAPRRREARPAPGLRRACCGRSRSTSST